VSIDIAAKTLAVDAAMLRVVHAFRLAGIEPILLKGQSFAAWLYDPGTRSYSDVDLIVDPRREDDAGRVLQTLGYTPEPQRPGLPVHATTWIQPEWSVEVDLHIRLPLTTDASVCWRELSQHTESLRIGAETITVLDEAARSMHVVIHALHNSSKSISANTDLDRALAVVSDDVWKQAAYLAWRLGAKDAFAVCLALHPAGSQLCHRLAIAPPVPVPVPIRLLVEGRSSSGAAALHDLTQLTGLWSRLLFVGSKIFASKRYVRRSDPLAESAVPSLPLLYVRYWLRLARKAPGAIRAWRGMRP